MGTNAVSNRDIMALPFADAHDLPYHPVDFQVATPAPSMKSSANVKTKRDARRCQNLLPNRPDRNLVDDAEHRDDVGTLRLGDEFGEDSDIIVGSLGVGVSHWAFQKLNVAFFPE